MKILFTVLFFQNLAFSSTFNPGDFKWMQSLKQSGVNEVNVCGKAGILNSKTSLQKEFITGASKKGFVFSQLPLHSKYWKILKEKNRENAESELKNLFSKTILWEVGLDGKASSLGTPEKIETRFTATVKDCVEGISKTIGGTCNHLAIEQREACCSEKFTGPAITWKKNKEKFTMLYSPDPSVRLRVAGEKNHRYCQVVDSIKF